MAETKVDKATIPPSAEDACGPTPEDAPLEARPSGPEIEGPARRADDETAEEDFVRMSDGDGPRSDRGTNPLPDVYWKTYAGEEGEK